MVKRWRIRLCRGEFGSGVRGGRMGWAPARRSMSRPDEIAYYLAYTPLEVTVRELVRIAGSRWAIEECFQAAKNECGLDQYEVCRYPGPRTCADTEADTTR
ncbi:hypothetical protein GCM10010431_55080 [Streptomyces kunmingensis]